MQHKTKRILNTLVKIIVASLLLSTIYNEVVQNKDTPMIFAELQKQLTPNKWHYLFFTLLLMPINWLLESLKWQQLIQPLTQEKMPITKAIKAILAGITISLFTPNRIGEYGGRILQLEARNNWNGIIATVVGSISQIIVLFSMGLIGGIYFTLSVYDVAPSVLLSSIIIGIGIIGILLLVYFNIDLVIPIVKRIPLGKWRTPVYKQLIVLRFFQRQHLLYALFFAFLRYLTYSLQYVLLLLLFEITAPAPILFAGVSTIFLVQTGIPMPLLFSLLVRSKLALTIWSPFSDNHWGILATTFGLFVINLSIPALLGLGIIVNINVVKSLGYEK